MAGYSTQERRNGDKKRDGKLCSEKTERDARSAEKTLHKINSMEDAGLAPLDFR